MPQTPRFYPAFLDLRNKWCLVVGGGSVALAKTRGLLRAGARVRVVAPRIGPGLARRRSLDVHRRAFQPRDIGTGPRAPWLVIAATDDEALNARIARLCRQRRVWVNVVDRPALCDFIAPSVVRRGALTFAVSTGGTSPALAKFVGRRLKDLFGPEYGTLARALGRLRPDLRRAPMAARRRILARVLNRSFIQRWRGQSARGLEQRLRREVLKSR
jgi:precorrin-2 dehydrogenase / sirohydrochlorin ferrochelatase